MHCRIDSRSATSDRSITSSSSRSSSLSSRSPPRSLSSPPPPKQKSPTELAQERLNRPTWAPIDDGYRASVRPSSTSTFDNFRYGIVVKYPTRSSANFASTMPKVASEYPKPLEPYHRMRPGAELSTQSLSSYQTRPISPAAM